MRPEFPPEPCCGRRVSKQVRSAVCCTASTEAELDRSGRVLVQPDCSLPNHPDIFVIGDMAACRDSNGHRLPGLAPVAMQQGAYVGRLIGKRLRRRSIPALPLRGQRNPCHHRSKSCGGELPQSPVRRFPVAWLAWLFVHLLYLVGFQNRVLVAIQWAFHYFTYNRKARLIFVANPTRSAIAYGSACLAQRTEGDESPAFMRVSVTRSSRMVRNLVVYTRRQICVPLKLGTSAGRLSMRCEELRLKICPIAGSSQAGQEGLPPRRPGAVFLPPIRLQSGAHQTQLLGAGGGKAAHHRASRSRWPKASRVRIFNCSGAASERSS